MKKFNHLINKEYICQLIAQTFEISVRFLDKNKNILHENSFNNIPNPFYASTGEQLNELYLENDFVNFPIIRTNTYLENFILIHLVKDGDTDGTFIIGPSIYSELLENKIERILNDFHVTLNKKTVLNYYHLTPVIKKTKLLCISTLLYYLIYQKKLNFNTVAKRNRLLNKPICNEKELDLQISICHQDNVLRNEIPLSIQMFETIKNGDKEGLLKRWNSFPIEKIGVLCSKSELRNRKNQAIAGIAVATRYSIEGGVPSDKAFTISDFYIESLEKLKDIKSIERLIEEAFCIFTDCVKRYQNQNYSKTIMDCKNYITKNIYQTIPLKQLAHITGKNPMYLSTLFKKEVGIPFSVYIQQEKVEEAKKLLTLTDHSILEISTLLNFNNQSYFTSIFKKYTKLTPKQYRNQYCLF
ncbi:helix-turn-helix domain-containing protein [Bacillus sp. K2I17]|uniref:helix-turn-helix domain-containing protein n=1 Tax=Bacillus sp. K2I17 TaxID=2014743 RepID=UPI000B519D31|nr:AraC family transcriptional regulator [Bacillus sp. K2I17]OWT47590.1 AraC family transcriptional regulator [Bacillus sp. K2I17]